MPRYMRSATLLVALLSCAATAQEPIADLMRVTNDALQFNPGYAAARAEYAAAREKLPIATGKLLPQIGVSAQYDWRHQSVQGDYFGEFDFERNDGFNRLVYGAQLEQAVFEPGLFIERSQAELQTQQAAYKLQADQDDLLMSVAESYFGLLAADGSLNLSQAEVFALERLLDQVRTRAQAGLATAADVAAAEAQFAIAEAGLVEAQDKRANALTTLEALTGRHYSKVKYLPHDLRLAPPSPQDEQVWIARARQTNPDLLSRGSALRIAELEYERAKWLSWPTLKLVGQAFRLDSGGGAAGEYEEQLETIGAVVKLPLFAGGQIVAGRRQTAQLVESARGLYDESVARTVRDTRIAFRNSGAGLKRVEALQRAVEASIVAEDATRAGYEVGTRTYAEVLSAVEKRYGAERDFSTSRYKFLVSTLKLKQLTGNLLVADLAAINRRLVDSVPANAIRDAAASGR